MRVAVCHSPHTRCGVREYGLALDISLSKLVGAVINASYYDFSVAESMGRGDVLLVHFEQGLVSSDLRDRLQRARERGAKVVFCCHIFTPPMFESWRPVVDRFVVHRDYGLTDAQIVEIPLGCPIYQPMAKGAARARFGLPEHKTILMTIGFLAPWKMMPRAVGVVLSAARYFPELFVCVQAPAPFAGVSKEEESAMRAATNRPGRAWLSMDFLGPTDLLDLVSASDLGFIYHPIHTGSVSAATKAFLSARRPLVTTTSNHASDIRCHHVQGLDLEEFAREVVAIAVDSKRLQAMQLGVESEYERLNMDTIAVQYANLFRSLVG